VKMNENKKTITFLAVAVAVALVAWITTRPSLEVPEAQDMRGKLLFPDFDDALAATSLEILEFDEETATPRPFKVAQVENRWSIPSHDNYPADAKDHLAEAAASLMGLKVLTEESDNPGDHAEYGVVDPDPDRLSSGATGVGRRVVMRDKNGKLLLALVIGKKVPDRDELRYVRAGVERGNKIQFKDPVYTVAVKTDKLSTKFEDWIEEDLLKLNYWDIKQVEIRDYSIDELAGTLNMRRRMVLDYDDTGDPKWKMTSDQTFGKDDWVDAPAMAEDEELDTDKLDDMKRALDDLEIVDVRRKPEGLSQNLRNLEDAEEFLNNAEAVASLQGRGFYRARFKDSVELFSNEGEIHCLMDDGARYLLRFGNIAAEAGGSSGDEEEQKDAKDEEKSADDEQSQDAADDDEDEEDADGGVNRYLFVMVEFDQSAIEKPELETPPEKPAEDQAEPKPKDAEADADDQDKKADTANKEETDQKKGNGEETGEEEASKDGEAEEEESEAIKEWKKEVERIEKENKRKQEEYDKKIEDGKKKVKELNDRFADWYYVIANDVYQKIHLSREDIVKKKEKDEEKDKADDEPDQAADEPDKDKAQADQPALEKTDTDKPGDDQPEAGEPGADQAKPDKPKQKDDAPTAPESPKPEDPGKGE